MSVEEKDELIKMQKAAPVYSAYLALHCVSTDKLPSQAETSRQIAC